MIITTSVVSNGRGCRLHLESDNLDLWQEKEPLYIAPNDLDEPECPDYFEIGGTCYLVFSHRGEARYMYSGKRLQIGKFPKIPTYPVRVYQRREYLTAGSYLPVLRELMVMPSSLTLPKQKKENGELDFDKLRY